MQGWDLAIVGGAQRLWQGAARAVFGVPQHCRKCGGHLVYCEQQPSYIDRVTVYEPAYFCPRASGRRGIRMVRNYLVVECDR